MIPPLTREEGSETTNILHSEIFIGPFSSIVHEIFNIPKNFLISQVRVDKRENENDTKVLWD